MSEHRKLLDAARSAVDLLNTVLGQAADDLDVTSSSSAVSQSDLISSATAEFTPARSAQLSSARREPAATESVLRCHGNHPIHQQTEEGSAISTKRVNSCRKGERNFPSLQTRLGESVNNECSQELNLRVRQLTTAADRRSGEVLSSRAPSQAKVSPQRSIAAEYSNDDVMDRIVAQSGRREECEHALYGNIAMEQALASSVLVLENAKLRDELSDARAEIATLHVEVALLKKLRVPTREAAAQTCARRLGDYIYQHEISSGDDSTDYLTTYSNSSPERRPFVPRRQRTEEHSTDAHHRKSDIYFYTPASTISTPGTLGRNSTVSSSGGPARRKLELPKSLKNGAAYLSITTYEDSDEVSTSSPSCGCCPFACPKFKLRSLKASRP
ncbi:uncharacterized protein [Diadema setosum]|uniref:uncharacterized protein isoform X2 n=1 Tax=Diadema setosum TaxID=31175 RepID=UPI003B3BB4A7